MFTNGSSAVLQCWKKTDSLEVTNDQKSKKTTDECSL